MEVNKNKKINTNEQKKMVNKQINNAKEYFARLENKNLNKNSKSVRIKNSRGIVKNKKRTILKASLIALSSIIVVIGGYDGYRKLKAFDYYSQGALDETNAVIKNDGYKKAPNIEAGYYNKHPLKICISETFNDFYQFTMHKGLEYLDRCAVGMKFDIFVGDVKSDNADVYICNPLTDDKLYSAIIKAGLYSGVCGWTQIPDEDFDKIQGKIFINPYAKHYFTPAQTVVHESLHLMAGLHHSDNVFSIMFPYTSTGFMSKQDIDNVNTVLPAEDSSSTYKYDETTNSIIHVFDGKNYKVNLVKECKNYIKSKQQTEEECL